MFKLDLSLCYEICELGKTVTDKVQLQEMPLETLKLPLIIFSIPWKYNFRLRGPRLTGPNRNFGIMVFVQRRGPHPHNVRDISKRPASRRRSFELSLSSSFLPSCCGPWVVCRYGGEASFSFLSCHYSSFIQRPSVACYFFHCSCSSIPHSVSTQILLSLLCHSLSCVKWCECI